MLQYEIKLKNVLSSNKTDIKKRGFRKSVSAFMPKFFLSGKGANPNISSNKKNENNQNNNVIESPSQTVKKIKKTFIRKYTTIIRENNNNNNENIQIKEDNKFKSDKISKFTSKTNQSFSQIEKIIYRKFFNQYIKYYFSYNKKNDDNESEKVTIYEYYQANNIISNKKCKLKVIFQEYKLYYDLDEYIVEYFILKECNYMLRFLLFFIYSRDIYVFDKEEDKKGNKTVIFRSFVKMMLERLEKINIFKLSFLYQIILNIKDINNKSIRRESIFDYSYKNKLLSSVELKNILGKEIKKEDLIFLDVDYTKYLPALMNLSKLNINTFLPNSFCFGNILNFYLHDFLRKRKVEKIFDYFTFQKNLKNKNKKLPLKRPSISGKKNYNKSFYYENIAQGKNDGMSFVTMDNLNAKFEDDNIYDYSLYINKNKNILRREVNDPEIKDIETFLNNIVNARANKKSKSIKFSVDIKDKKEKDALINKMVKRKENKASSYVNFKENLYSNLNSKINSNNKISILKNLNKKFSNLKNGSKIINYNTNRKYSLPSTIGCKEKESYEELKTSIKNNNKNSNNVGGTIDDKINRIHNIIKINPPSIRQYSFRHKTNTHKMLVKKINNSNSNNDNSNNHKDSKVIIPSINSTILGKIKNKRKEKYKINSLHYHKGSISSISSRGFSMRKSNSTININSSINNNLNEKNKKYNFKKLHEFFFEFLRQSNKYEVKNLLLENIESANRDPNSKYTIEYKKFFGRRVFRYFPPKYFEANDNVWKDGEFKDSRYKSKYDYNLLMIKIRKQIQKNKDNYKNLLQKEINIKQISKSADIYL